MADELPHPLGEFELLELLGRGGAGTVYLAERDGERYALKLLNHGSAADADQLRRFAREARAAARVHHPRVMAILESGEVLGRPYLLMPYVKGGTLGDRLDREGPLGVADLLRVAEQVADGLEACHAAGLLHRDVKASNVLMAVDGDVWLTDFGLARVEGFSALTRPGQMMGTLEYIAPETIRGERATPAVDIYAFGCLLYACLTGKTPFADRSMMAMGMAHLEEAPVNPCRARHDIPVALSEALRRATEAMLAKEPSLRPVGARQAVAAVLAFPG